MAGKTKRKAEPAAKDEGAEQARTSDEAKDREGGMRWAMADQMEEQPIRWLLNPWIPLGMLSMVVGHPNVGKSTFLAWIISLATHRKAESPPYGMQFGRVILLPGHEEQFEVMTLPRLKKAGVALDRVKVLERGNVSLARDRDRLTGIARRFGATLIVGDPIDSYVEDCFSEDRGQDVRPLLEAAGGIAQDTGAAVVFARHPGKDPNNIMPGSRQWRAVPRIIVQLTSDGHIPPRYLISHFKDSLGTEASPRRYSLLDDGSGPRRFGLEEEVDQSAEEMTRTAGGPCGRYKLQAACRLVRWVFGQEEKPTRVGLAEEARKQELGADTVNEALRLLGVKAVPPAERGGPWYLVRTQEEWPAWLPEVTPP